MSRPFAFVADLADLRFNWPDRTLRVEAALPLQDFDALSARIGLPAALDGHDQPPPPALALLPCRQVRHPDREVEALADAALSLLEGLIEGGQLRIDVRRARRVEALARALPFQPLHVVRDAEG